ncbi:l-galactose dehydrogenase [Penicillium brasilianum]|uniref:L-galactose dehydrogenase n=1 Tax=Penicillium brasilianum TaxID=104259 RepID=A0A1S9RYC7_PENBI|nr:l-galactose dehydrogenase [Penicillium brasilianum]
MSVFQASTPLSHLLPPLILGGAGFSHQVYRNPDSAQALQVLKRAFQLGLRAIDTSAYYHPSEILLGEALSHPEITSQYSRDQYLLMTKVGRVTATEFDYSPVWVRQSVMRSLERLHTRYLDVVFCHDVEFVPEEEVLGAIGVLLDMVREGYIKYVGISGYRIDILARLARRVQIQYSRPLDIIQNWAQMTLQNDRLAREGLKAFQEAGVSCVCNSSPLAIGLLRANGVPVGDLGDFHPAPSGLRSAVKEAADYVASQGESMAALALRHSIRRAQLLSTPDFRITTIMGITSIAELEDNLATARQVLRVSDEPRWLWSADAGPSAEVSINSVTEDAQLCAAVHNILGPWHDYSFPSPGDDWDVANKKPAAARL